MSKTVSRYLLLILIKLTILSGHTSHLVEPPDAMSEHRQEQYPTNDC